MVDDELVFHYTNPKGITGILDSKSIWATSVRYLNDYSEFSHGINNAKGMCDYRIDRLDPEGGERTKVLQLFYKDLKSNLGCFINTGVAVASFSTRLNQLSQWRAYCPDGGGFCMGFDRAAIASLCQKQNFTFAKCVYDSFEQGAILRGILDNNERQCALMKLDDRGAIAHFSRKSLEDIINIVPRFKHPDFYEEDEWRLFYVDSLNLNIRPNNEWHFRPTKDSIAPYVAFDLRDENGLVPLRKVYAGPGITGGESTGFFSQYLRQQGFERIEFGISNIPYRSS